MSRNNSPRRMQMQDYFAMLPVPVLQSFACRDMSGGEWTTLAMLAGQYRGRNNGRLDATERTCRQHGLSRRTAAWALPRLTGRGLIQKTHQGGKRPLGPTLWAITWQPIDAVDGRDLLIPREAPNTWQRYRPSAENSINGAIHCARTAQPIAPLGSETEQPFAHVTRNNGAIRCSPSRNLGGSPGAQVPARRPGPASTTKVWTKPAWLVIPRAGPGA